MTHIPRQGRPTDPELEAKVSLLRAPDTYPEKPDRVEALETHMSWVFLTDHDAYKLKKPVRYAFLDFSTLSMRQRHCEEEVRLNRRLAPDVYLGTVALTRDARGILRLGGDGEPVEWLVRMCRLPANRMLDALIRERALRQSDIDSLGSRLARFYQTCSPVAMKADQYRAELASAIELNRAELSASQYGLPAGLVDKVCAAQTDFLHRQAGLVDARVAAGKIVEGHGDLRPEHVCLLPEPVVIDCLEFSSRLRTVDPVDELAFLAMECERLGDPQVGESLLRIYADVTHDRPPAPLLSFYKSYRAGLRARFAIAHLRELNPTEWPKWRDSAIDYLHRAEGYCGQFSAN